MPTAMPEKMYFYSHKGQHEEFTKPNWDFNGNCVVWSDGNKIELLQIILTTPTNVATTCILQYISKHGDNSFLRSACHHFPISWLLTDLSKRFMSFKCKLDNWWSILLWTPDMHDSIKAHYLTPICSHIAPNVRSTPIITLGLNWISVKVTPLLQLYQFT